MNNDKPLIHYATPKPEEAYRWIAGYENLYEVSNFGNVRSVPRTVWHGRSSKITLPGKNLSLIKTKLGYRTVSLSRNGEVSVNYVHRLVAQAFLPNPSFYPVVRHLDGNPANNYYQNLAWGTQSDNLKDAIRHGMHRSPNGERNYCKYGHEYTEENTHISPRQRTCRTCKNRSQNERRARNKLGTSV